MKRAYTVVDIKAMDDEERTIEGIATTPITDRMEDIIEPAGAIFRLPMPLLWQHNSREPVGNVIEAKVTKDGIRIKAKFAKVNEPASLKERLDTAWGEIKAKLVRGLSIGFSPIEWSDIKGTYGLRYTKWEWLELSAVTIPANSDATITAIKSVDQAARRATHGAPGGQRVVRRAGKSGSPDASGTKPPVRRIFFPE